MSIPFQVDNRFMRGREVQTVVDLRNRTHRIAQPHKFPLLLPFACAQCRFVGLDPSQGVRHPDIASNDVSELYRNNGDYHCNESYLCEPSSTSDLKAGKLHPRIAATFWRSSFQVPIRRYFSYRSLNNCSGGVADKLFKATPIASMTLPISNSGSR